MLNFLKTLGLTEIILVQIILYALLWLSNEYLASLVTFVMVPIMIAILLISLLADMVEKSRVPKFYYRFLIVSILTPIMVYAFFMWAFEGVLDWME